MVFPWGSVSATFGKALATFGLPSPLKPFESGQTEPCLGSLATFAKAFGLGLAELLDEVPDDLAHPPCWRMEQHIPPLRMGTRSWLRVMAPIEDAIAAQQEK
jgi:hypothetical protein